MRRTESVRGRISCAVRPVGEFDIDGYKPIILCTVKVGDEWCIREGKRNGWYARDFAYHCDRLGIETKLAHDHDGYLAVYECVGTLDALDEIVERLAVLSWEPVIAVRVPFAGQGDGEEKTPFVPQIEDGKPAAHKTTRNILRNLRVQAIMESIDAK